MAERGSYEDDQKRFHQDWELRAKDAELIEQERRREEERAAKQALKLFVENLGYSEEDAIEMLRKSGRFGNYFDESSD